MTRLKRRIIDLIAATGPISVSDYMALCLFDPRDGYYTNRQPFGATGDFVTAPEISQMFGELVAVWCYAAWQALGSPAACTLAEIGPGRGTLMKDMLRTLQGIGGGFLKHAAVALVEISPRLVDLQKQALAGAPAETRWYHSVRELPPQPLIMVGNELFDAIPMRQFVKTGGVWRERMVGADGDSLHFGLGAATIEPALLPPGAPEAAEGSVFEAAPQREALMGQIAEHITRHRGAALFVDYGHTAPGFGDTLQAVRAHAYEDVLASPGEADLTSHVDFAAVAQVAGSRGLQAHLSTQGEFLLGMGLLERAGSLGSAAPDFVRERIAGEVERLAGPDAMGTLFKVLAAVPPGITVPPIRRELNVPAAEVLDGNRPSEDPGGSLTAAARGETRLAMSQSEFPEPLRSPLLQSLAGIRHGYFTRQGGVSDGIYASLNIGTGSADDQALVRQNRARVADWMGVAEGALLTAHQIHSPVAIAVREPFAGERPRADAVVTDKPGLAVGASTADCGPVLFADPQNRIVGAAHAGWKGAFTGILENTIVAMEALGAQRQNLVAVLGPSIGPLNYEVGAEFVERFMAADAGNRIYFTPSGRPGHSLFDLNLYTVDRLNKAGVRAEALNRCTYAEENLFFSYRRTTHRNEPDYGRQISAIALEAN